MYDDELAKSDHWRTWGILKVLTIREAAWLLCNDDPDKAAIPSTPTQSTVKAIMSALLESLSDGELIAVRHIENDGYGAIVANSKRDDADESSTMVRIEELQRWADKRELHHRWRSSKAESSLDIDLSQYPLEIRIAIEAYDAVRHDEKALAGKSPKAALRAWLKSHQSTLSEEARERIATMSNWGPKGGAPKTPSSE